jgi:hypothetical protein
VARHAVFTIVQDDPVNLEIWARHYRRHYSDLDTYVLHHLLPGESAYSDWILGVEIEIARRCREGSFTVLPVCHAESFDHTWLRETVQTFQRFLLRTYDTVLFTEVDEIVTLNPTSGSALHGCDFVGYLETFTVSGDRPYQCCTGYEVVHDYATEPDLDFASLPLLRQRTYWYQSEQYSKPLLSKVPLTWGDGFHELQPDTGYEWPQDPDPALLLLHLHKVDFLAALIRHGRSATRNWSRADIVNNRGIQNRMADPSWLREWWLNTVDRPSERARWTRMPDAVKEVV